MNGFVRHTTNPFESPALKRYFLDKIDRIAGLKNSRVVYYDGAHIWEVRPYPPICQQSYLTVIIRKVTEAEVVSIQQPTVTKKQNNSRFISELMSTSLSCGAAVFSWLAFSGSTSAIPFSAGTSSILSVLTFSAATASTAQCINSGYRLINEIGVGDPETNTWLDSQDWYQSTMTALDVISVAGAGVAMGATLKLSLQLQKAGTPFKEVLKGLNRQQRRSLTFDIIRSQNPGVSNKAIKAMIAAGVYPKRFGKVELSSTVKNQLVDAVGATFSFLGSATSGVIRAPSKMSDLAIGVIEEFEIF